MVAQGSFSFYRRSAMFDEAAGVQFGYGLA